MTRTYITTKIVAAWEAPSEKGDPGYSVSYPDGYQSWCPKDEFERTSRPMSGAEQALANTYGTSGIEASQNTCSTANEEAAP